jgi:hypothetical protein
VLSVLKMKNRKHQIGVNRSVSPQDKTVSLSLSI